MITIGRFEFKTKAACEAHIRDVLRRNDPMPHFDVSPALAGEDLAFIQAVIEAHPRRRVVVECGISSIHVQELSPGVRRFLVRRTDGSVRDFSWRHSITPLSQAQRVAKVCRHYIEDQKEQFRRSHPVLVNCARCGRSLGRADAHVDHESPWTFERLVEDWARTVRVNLEDVELIDKTGYGQETEFADVFLAETWREYHEINARLRLLCRRCNLSATRKKVA